jgi:pyruvate dehydrogenase E1 component alpha subunit
MMNSGAKQGVTFLRSMIQIRQFEEACAELYSAGKIRGFLHLYIGEEAIAVGAIQALTPEDVIFATYREHAHALVRGVPASSIMAEMFGRVNGCCRGRGGSMHIFDRSRNFIGGNAIVGGALPMAVGMALALKHKKSSALAACFFGEGAMAEGEFHEAINLAAVWELPVLFLCENNFYAMGTALERWESQVNLVKHAESYGVASRSVDGMDVMEVHHAAKEATCFIREFKKPFFLECQTYRFRAHSMFDAEKYRSKDEVEQWKKRDPIKHFGQELMKSGVIVPSDLQDIERQCQNELQMAIKEADAGAVEPATDLLRYTYAESVEPIQPADCSSNTGSTDQ